MTHKFGICLYMPDMPQNLGVIIRTAACLEFPLHIIKPLSFSMTDKRFKGAVMDYIDQCEIVNHDDWNNFEKYCDSNNKRIVLATTKTNNSFYNYSFSNSDIILFGKETAGVPQEIHKKVTEKITIPINQKTRSLNLATSVSIIASQIISNL
jgi:tRNA (cytidine/uridine-2'-O-)-methyltransferase